MRHPIVGFHLGDLLLHQLMVRDLRAECLTFQRICDGSVARRANDAGRARRDGVSALFKREHRDLEALAFFTDTIFFRHAYVLERKVSGVTGTDAELAVYRSRSEPLHRSFDDETGHPGVIAFATL